MGLLRKKLDTESLSKDELEVLVQKLRTQQEWAVMITFILTAFIAPMFTYFKADILRACESIAGQTCEKGRVEIHAPKDREATKSSFFVEGKIYNEKCPQCRYVTLLVQSSTDNIWLVADSLQAKEDGSWVGKAYLPHISLGKDARIHAFLSKKRQVFEDKYTSKSPDIVPSSSILVIRGSE